MGLSASQARLLTLTSRLHDIEYQQQQLANTKLRFSIESDEVSSKYSQELSKQKLQFKNDSGNYVDMTLRTLLESGQYSLIRTSDGKKIVAGDVSTGGSSNDATSGRYSLTGPTPAPAFRNTGSRFDLGGNEDKQSHVPIWDNERQAYLVPNGEHTVNGLPVSVDGYWYLPMNEWQQILNDLQSQRDGGVADHREQSPQYEIATIDSRYLNDANWLYEAIESGEFRLVDAAGSQVNPTSTTGIDTISDRSNEAKAKADYDAAMNKINKKEKAIDVQMRQLETEYQATNQDLTSVKSLVEKHTKDDFSLFG